MDGGDDEYDCNLLVVDITLSKIGRGTFGQVFKCHDLLLDKQCAVKVIRSAPKYRESGKIELRVLEKLQETKCANDK